MIYLVIVNSQVNELPVLAVVGNLHTCTNGHNHSFQVTLACCIYAREQACYLVRLTTHCVMKCHLSIVVSLMKLIRICCNWLKKAMPAGAFELIWSCVMLAATNSLVNVHECYNFVNLFSSVQKWNLEPIWRTSIPVYE